MGPSLPNIDPIVKKCSIINDIENNEYSFWEAFTPPPSLM
jgi:hypothetical protein